MKMSITTKTGDRGTTRLFSGEEVSKDSLRPNAYGDLDELVSILGVARCHCPAADTQQAILELQRELFVAGSEMATTPGAVERLDQRIDAARLAELERRMAELEAAIEVPDSFIVPGGSPAGAFLDLARSVSRRLERRAVGLCADGELDNDNLIVWLNRLSDYLYLLARSAEDKPTLVKSE